MCVYRLWCILGKPCRNKHVLLLLFLLFFFLPRHMAVKKLLCCEKMHESAISGTFQRCIVQIREACSSVAHVIKKAALRIGRFKTLLGLVSHPCSELRGFGCDTRVLVWRKGLQTPISARLPWSIEIRKLQHDRAVLASNLANGSRFNRPAQAPSLSRSPQHGCDNSSCDGTTSPHRPQTKTRLRSGRHCRP